MAEGGDAAKRQVACKVRIAEVLDGRYVKEDGWLPNYIDTGARKFSRANIIGVLVSKDSDAESGAVAFMLDDGSGRVSLRFFEFASSLGVGDIVNVIGRPREFGSERYVVPEVVKKITDPKWVELRKLELTKGKQEEIIASRESSNAVVKSVPNAPIREEGVMKSAVPMQPVKEESLIVEEEEFSGGIVGPAEVVSPIKKIFDAIKELDDGLGVGFDALIVKTKIDDVDIPIRKLLEQGDIFEIKPGRYKVLE